MIKNVVVVNIINDQECKNFIIITELSKNNLNIILLSVDDGSCQIMNGLNYVDILMDRDNIYNVLP